MPCFTVLCGFRRDEVPSGRSLLRLSLLGPNRPLNPNRPRLCRGRDEAPPSKSPHLVEVDEIGQVQGEAQVPVRVVLDRKRTVEAKYL